MHGHDHAATASRRPTHHREDAQGVPVDLFVDLASGWTCWIPRWPAEAGPPASQAAAAARRARGQGRLVGLLARVGALLGACGHVRP